MSGSRLALAFENGTVTLPPEGQVVVFGPVAGQDLSALPKDRLQLIQGFYPDHQFFSERGYSVVTQAEGASVAAVVFLPRAKAEGRLMLATAMKLTQGGPVIVDGLKSSGIDSFQKDCRKLGATIGAVYSKAHGKTYTATGGDFDTWLAATNVAGPDGFVTAPGVFSADGVDPGSAVLAAALPEKLKGNVADLGAGWGYLAAQALKHPRVTACHLIEAEFGALDCARHNIDDPRAEFHWADATEFMFSDGFDQIVMNPPFHTGRAADPALGRAFIASAARLLAPRGTLWLVANRHLPYESALSASFKDVSELTGDRSFKVFRAA
ncbi:MAG: class I SAM-dependent methyltransferase, partial [Marinosulfonomonas sp.]|nr:class I SAM-dependent methyltransferase [Marinosulfonomonas sp.]